MVEDNPNADFLLKRNFITFHSIQTVAAFFLRERCKRETQCWGVKFHIRCKVVCNGRCRLAKHIGHDEIQRYIADGEGALFMEISLQR